MIAWRIAPNRRLLCAGPAYLARHGTPKAPNDLTSHNRIGIRQGEEAYGVWRLSSGHGILMRAEWGIERHQLAARVRVFVDFVALSFSLRAGAGAGPAA